MKCLVILVAILCVVSFPNPTVGSQKKAWPKPSELAKHNENYGDSKVGWACSSSSNSPSPPGSFPNIPGFPIIPNIPGLPFIPGFPRPPFESLLVSQSGELDRCLTNDGSKTNEKCFSQIFSSWAETDFALDKECCEIVVNMDRSCFGHLHMMFKSHFFPSLLQYSCHIKHANKN